MAEVIPQVLITQIRDVAIIYTNKHLKSMLNNTGVT